MRALLILLLMMDSAPQAMAGFKLLTPECREGLVKIVPALGIPNRVFSGPIGRLRYGPISADQTYLAAHLSIATGSPSIPALRELEDLLVRFSEHPHPSEDLKQSISLLASKHQPGLKIAWPDDLPELFQSFRKQGKYHLREGDYLQGTNTTIPFRFYGSLISEDWLPMADPHDLLNHFPSFIAVPETWPLVKRRFHLVRQLDGLLGRRNFIEERYVFINSMRWLSHEQFPLKTETNGQASLVYFGGGAYEFATNATDFSRNDPGLAKQIAGFLHPSRYKPYRSSDVVRNPFEVLPGWEEFAQSNPSNLAAYTKALSARRLESHEQAIEFHEQLATHLEPAVKNFVESKQDLGEAPLSLVQDAALRAATFPDSQVFSKEAYLKLYSSSLDLLQEYVRWYRDRKPKKSTQN